MTGLIILAAGGSGRLGQPKQNLVFNGQTLLQRAAKCGQETKCKPIIIVLGANSGAITPVPGTTTLYNSNWKEGMSSSIKTAMTAINSDASIDKVIIMLCDQPFVSARLLNTMIAKQEETGKPIVACTYNGILGVPALFDHTMFAKLLLLQGNDGAKKILKIHANDVVSVQFDLGSIDIDTMEDYNRLLQSGD